jgi:hypothetical protein
VSAAGQILILACSLGTVPSDCEIGSAVRYETITVPRTNQLSMADCTTAAETLTAAAARDDLDAATYIKIECEEDLGLRKEKE